MFSIFTNPESLSILREVLIIYAKQIKPPVTCVVALDARGFLLGPFIALELKIPFVPVRKQGKLPGAVISETYDKEYGQDILQIQTDSIQKGAQVLIVDDLLATGGSLKAACRLVEAAGGKPAVCLVLMELTDLRGRPKIPTEVISIFKY